mgnify:CR=1 FL=1|tara:strand:+ start:197 stop:742 length:546 start_codon:yes stop_codon:yes gene_type:complete
MITKKELLQLIEKSKLTRQDFSKRLMRSPGFINVYLCRHFDVLPLKFTCLVIHHFSDLVEEVLGRQRQKEMQDLSRGVDFDPRGKRGASYKVARKRRKKTLKVSLFDIEYDDKIHEQDEKFSKILKRVRQLVRTTHPDIYQHLNFVQWRFLIGVILKASAEVNDDFAGTRMMFQRMSKASK